MFLLPKFELSINIRHKFSMPSGRFRLIFLVAIAAAVLVASGNGQVAKPEKKTVGTMDTLPASAQANKASNIQEDNLKYIGIPAVLFGIGIVKIFIECFLSGKPIEENLDSWQRLTGKLTGRLSIIVVVPRVQRQIDEYATEAVSGQRGIIPTGRKYKVIAFDLDGTLLRGLDYSWSAVWEELGLQPNYCSTAMLAYMKNQISYEEWCERDFQQLRNFGLTKKHFNNIASKIRVTNHLRDAILDLRTNGLIVAIISGGVDALLKAMIPDADELFDYICINRMKFGSDQVICDIEPTPFDFDNKATALAAICRKHGCTLRESVFVGEGPNDSKAARVAGLSIAYPPKLGGLIAWAGIRIDVDDLREILPYVYELPQPRNYLKLDKENKKSH